MKKSHTNYYGLKLLVTLMLLLIMLAYTSFYLVQNYYSKAFLDYSPSKKEIFFLESDSLKDMYEKNRMDYEDYKTRVDYFKKLVLENGYSSKNIYSDKLKTLKKDSILIVLDMMSMSKDEIDDVDNFVSKGGKIIFNFTSGFLDSSLMYQQDNLVSRITTLKIDKSINTIEYDRNSTAFMSAKLLSPLTKKLQMGKALELALYDPLPIFDTPSSVNVDAYLTNWSQSNYMTMKKNKELLKKQSAIVWHGYKGQGKWVYFSFPSYSFIEIDPSLYAGLFSGMLSYLQNEIVVAAYPYIDADNAIFVSEDTEYKYENLKQFYDVAQKYKFPVTAFCVANLAKKNEALMKLVSKSKYVEIGSHSYTHKKILGESDAVYKRETEGSKELLDSISKQNIIGFRPPREELDQKMIKVLANADYKYIFGEGEDRLTPYFVGNIMIMPKHGTDDYSYLVNLDWDSSEVLKEIKHEANVLVDLNGIYTLSTHTHLMTFSSNIKIVDNFFKYVKSQKRMFSMNGKMIYDRVSKRDKLTFHTTLTDKKFILDVLNANKKEVKNMHFAIYVDIDINIQDVESEIIGTKTQLIKKTLTEYTLIIKSLKPKSQMLFFLNYAKNN